MKRLTVIILTLLCGLAAMLSGCDATIPLTTRDGTTYDVTSVGFSNEYAGRVPSDGTMFLLVTVQGEDSELDTMQNLFFGSTGKAQVSDGTTTQQCTLVVYAPRSGGKLDMVLLFQVPTAFSHEFSMSGEGFESVSLTVEE